MSTPTPVTITPAPPPTTPRVSSLTVVICMTVVVVGLLAAYVVMSRSGHDATPLLTVLVAVIGAGIPGVAALGKSQEVSNAVATVQHQTNGNMSRLLDIAQQVVAAQIGTAVQAHVTAQQAIAAVTDTAPVVVPPSDVAPPPTSTSNTA